MDIFSNRHMDVVYNAPLPHYHIERYSRKLKDVLLQDMDWKSIRGSQTASQSSHSVDDVDHISSLSKSRHESQLESLQAFHSDLMERVKTMGSRKREGIKDIQEAVPDKNLRCHIHHRMRSIMGRSLSDEALSHADLSSFPETRDYIVYPDEKYESKYFQPTSKSETPFSAAILDSTEQDMRMYYRSGWIDELRRARSMKFYHETHKTFAILERQPSKHLPSQPRVVRNLDVMTDRQPGIFADETKIRIFKKIGD